MRSPAMKPLIWIGLLGAAAVWACWPALRAMGEIWEADPKYSHAYIVPLIALAILWSRRAMIQGQEASPSYAGLAWVGGGAAVQLASAYFFLPWLRGLAPLFYLAGGVVLVGGRGMLRWSWPSILFLAFMIPLPYRVEVAMGYPLQRLATVASVYTLQTLGLPALADGTIIRIDDLVLGVAEACSGLSMLMSFGAIAVAVAVLVERPWAHRVVILLSAIPIAVVSNVIRVTATAFVHRMVGSDLANLVFHDLAGWFMMPTALALLLAELAVLDRLLVVEEVRRSGPLASIEALSVEPVPRSSRGPSALGAKPLGPASDAI